MLSNGHSAPVRVLVVDDQAVVRDGIAAIIASLIGFSVIATCGTCAEALRLAVEKQPEFVLLDVLPETTIFQCAAEIIALLPGVKLLLIDDEPNDLHIQQALRLAANGYLTKHQSKHELEAALRQSLVGERVFDLEVAKRLVFSPDGTRLGPDPRRHMYTELTPREMDVLMHVARGLSVKECARLLGISASTVDNHKSRLMKKLRVHKTVELTNLAMREGLLTTVAASSERRISPDHDQRV
ncbi:MAG TPA: response regulator transcription factor [Pirellulales bacterium]|nr:response regulator transcription factor [Pirellulales bacterium]